VLDRPLELSHDHGRVLLLEPSIRQPPLNEARLDIRHQVVHDLLVTILASLTVTVDEVIVGWNLEAGGGGCSVVSALDVSFSFSLSTSLFLLPSLGVVTHSLLELGAEATQGRETVLDPKRFSPTIPTLRNTS